MWNDRFSGPDYLFGKEPAAFIIDHAAYLKAGAKGLAVADGEGRNSVFMAQQGVETVAMDASANALDKARALAKDRGVSVDFHEASIHDWAWEPEAFDLVVAIFIQFLSPAERIKVFKGMVTSLKPGGHLLLHGYTPKQLEYGTGGPSARELLYTEELLRDLFDGLELVELRSYEREINEGKGHAGMSALIDLVARKPG